MTFAVPIFNPIAAVGISKSRSISGGNKPTEGDTDLVFANVSSAITVGESVFMEDQSGNDIQYLGLCTVSSGTGITVTNRVQNTPATSATIWVPTSSFAPSVPNAIGGQTHADDDGTRLIPTRGNSAFMYQVDDASRSITFSFDVIDPDEYGDWRTFRRTRLAQTFSWAFYDHTVGASVTHEIALPGTHSVRKTNKAVSAFSFDAFIQNEDTYVTS